MVLINQNKRGWLILMIGRSDEEVADFPCLCLIKNSFPGAAKEFVQDWMALARSFAGDLFFAVAPRSVLLDITAHGQKRQQISPWQRQGSSVLAIEGTKQRRSRRRWSRDPWFPRLVSSFSWDMRCFFFCSKPITAKFVWKWRSERSWETTRGKREASSLSNTVHPLAAKHQARLEIYLLACGKPAGDSQVACVTGDLLDLGIRLHFAWLGI